MADGMAALVKAPATPIVRPSPVARVVADILGRRRVIPAARALLGLRLPLAATAGHPRRTA